jgi:hypothetical protein
LAVAALAAPAGAADAVAWTLDEVVARAQTALAALIDQATTQLGNLTAEYEIVIPAITINHHVYLLIWR